MNASEQKPPNPPEDLITYIEHEIIRTSKTSTLTISRRICRGTFEKIKTIKLSDIRGATAYEIGCDFMKLLQHDINKNEFQVRPRRYKFTVKDGYYVKSIYVDFDAVLTKEDRTSIKADELRSGDYFSYTGSFKIYKAISDPEADPEFRGVDYCVFCDRLAEYDSRVILDVTDGELNHRVRLRSDVECKIHPSFDD